MNIMIVTNSAYLKPAYIMLHSLFLHHQQEEMDIYLPYEDISESELAELTSFAEHYAGKKIYPLYVGDEFKKKVQSRNGINVETYYRILGINLLPESVDRILYLDVDMVIRGSLNALYEMELGSAAFAVCEDIYGIINGFHAANKRRLRIPEQYSYFNAGVMLYNVDFLRKTDAVEKILDNIYQNYERYEYNDQDVMNEMYYDNLVYVGWDEYNCPPVWCYLDKEKMEQGVLEFADYNEIRVLAKNPELMLQKYQNVTRQIYENAKAFMRENGNKDQWGDDYPSRELIEQDLDDMYLCMAENQIACVFYYKKDEDEEYGQINGKWLNDEPYAVVHRVASTGIIKGAASYCLDWAYSQIPNLRMDTYRDNIPMQKLLEKCGFQYCGSFERLGTDKWMAYHKE